MDTGLIKLLWVAAPLLAAVALVAWWALRGRSPSRQGLNVGFSLLLLAYVLTTAGLGIFWVANQQLPVFDWHYLFGYATVLLLLVHLAFNLRMVWHYLRRKATGLPHSSAAATGAAAPRPGRRPWLGAAGLGAVAAAAGLGYLLGLRHGRTEFKFGDAISGTHSPSMDSASADSLRAGHAAPASAPATATTATDPAWAVVQQFHAFSAHSRRGLLRHAASSDWGLAPPPFKRYPDTTRVDLPSLRPAPPAAPAPPPLPAGLAAPEQDARAVALADLGSLLWHTAGISLWRGGIPFRTSPSSGALFATELYVLAPDWPGLEWGPWHYDPEHHALHRLADASARADVARAAQRFGLPALPAQCRAVVIASAIFARSGHKYGDRTYRYVLADLGHALENLRVAARERNGSHLQLLTHFDELAIGHALGLDARREGVLAVAALSPSPPLATTAPAEARAWSSALTAAGSARALPATMGLTEAMQAATSLQAGSGRAGEAGAATAPARPTSPAAQAAPAATAPPSASRRLPEARTVRGDALRVIAQRRSVRRFAAKAVSQQALADILAAITSGPQLLSSAVRIDLVTSAAQGLPPAAWRHDPAAGTLHQRVQHGADLRQRARAAGLDQDVIGDAAVVFVLSLDIATLRADPFGPARGYRHGFIEAGLVGERLYLAAGALGLGVCAVGAFYDDEAAALVGLDATREWPVHFAALGVPA